MKLNLIELFTLPRDQFYVILRGKLIDDWSTLNENDNFQVHLRVLGGKGGFGSLLRSFGSQFYKSTNQDMCRDLSGRRLKDVKEEEKLKKYISKASQRESEKQKKLDEKYKKLKNLGEKKHEFNDSDYSRQKERILEETEDALQQGLEALKDKSAVSSTSDEPGPSGVSSKVLGKRKRDDSDDSVPSTSFSSTKIIIEKSEPETKKVKKSMAGSLWLGIDGVNESDLDSDESGSEETEECVKIEKETVKFEMKKTKKDIRV